VNTGASNGNYTYGYAPGNKRVWRATWSYDSNFMKQVPGTDEITFWSPSGQKMGTYQLGITWVTSSVDNSACVTSFFATQTGTNYYFGGKLIKNAPGAVYSDRLGSVGQYYPYGTDKGSGNPASGEKFTGYVQDAETGLDYSVNRYQQPGSGRFLTADPYQANKGGPGDPSDPTSWNRYSYTGGDPVNRTDPSGRDWCFADDYQGPCNGSGSNGICWVSDLVGVSVDQTSNCEFYFAAGAAEIAAEAGTSMPMPPVIQ
jgi:RHS repeat-associated protein